MALSEGEREAEMDKMAMYISSCPPYNQCAKEKKEWLLHEGLINCIGPKKGCLCLEYPFAEQYKIGVKYNFYCMRDSEMEQRRL